MAARHSAGNRTLDPDLARHLANRVRAARLDRDVSQETLAQLAGVSTLQIVRIESARANPTLATLAGVATALELPVTALLD